jgi:hypothetical protein
MIQQEDIIILNTYAPNIGAPEYIKQALLNIKEQIGLDTVLVGVLNTQILSIDRTFRQKINKDVLELKYTVDEMNLTYIYRAFYPEAAEYTFFSAAHRTFSKIDYILDHNVNLRTNTKINQNNPLYPNRP